MKPTNRQISYISWRLDQEDLLPDRIEGKVNNKKVHLEDWIEKNLNKTTASDIIDLLSQNNYQEAISQISHLGYSLDTNI